VMFHCRTLWLLAGFLFPRNFSNKCSGFSPSLPIRGVSEKRICIDIATADVKGHGKKMDHFSRLKLASEDNQNCSQSDDDSDLDTSQNFFGLTDDEFGAWLTDELANSPGRQQYKTVFDQAIVAIIKWRQRYRGNPKIWKRIFKKERVLKELIESAPIIHSVQIFVNENENRKDAPYTILDLCSGKGYLSMFLSEILPPEKVQKIILIDKAWAMCNAELLPHHINWDHIYGTIPDGNNDDGKEQDTEASTYFTTWPIPLHTSKQDLKQSCNPRQMKKYVFDRTDGPIIILAVHLCGTLALRAVNLFNLEPNVEFFALKPCCLPQMVHAQREEVFRIGKHSFPAEDVCSNGSFNKNNWTGPPRWHLEKKFQLWSDHLFQGIDVVEDSNPYCMEEKPFLGQKEKREVPIQIDGGFQNTYLLAERSPLTTNLWRKKNEQS